jgi:4-diphosphocytidyl-2-C-methyl-D-erythritol kinase
MILTTEAYAKLNLTLRIGAPDHRRYHPIRSIFQTVDWSDSVDVEVGGPAGVEFLGADIPAENTVTKALRLVSEIAPLAPLRVTVTKRIPAESGLGGGSSDAAALLRIIQRLHPGLPPAELAGIAAAVGADVPFFLTGGRALAEGYGERLTTLPDPGPAWFVVIRPPVGCGTVAMYQALDAARPHAEPLADAPIGTNDFESVAPEVCRAAIQSLRDHGLPAGLSGSGSAVFGVCESESHAHAIAQTLDPRSIIRVAKAIPADLSRAVSVRLT